ncbi:NEW3 domain-containing protein [Chloroflexota bacterium]
MSRFRAGYYLTCAALLLMLLGGLVTAPIASATSDTHLDLPSLSPNQKSPETEGITLTCQYPVLSSPAGTSFFAYAIELQYKGSKEPRVFDLKVEVPAGFSYAIASSYGEGSEIAAIRLDPQKQFPDTIKVTVRPYMWLVPEPGEYPITVEAASGEIEGSIELKAIVIAKYEVKIEPAIGRLNTTATAGKDNYFTIFVKNTGTADLQKVNFSSTIMGKPSGWSITFDPQNLDVLPVSDEREVQINIKPAQKTIAGDYMVAISANPESGYAFDAIDVRITVLTPTIWGWVGIGIVVLVIAGLVVMFMRLGRR